MALLFIIVALTSIAAGLAVGRLVRHWLAYVVAAVLGPFVGVATLFVVGYLTVEPDNAASFLLRTLGQSMWVGLMFAPFGAFLSRQQIRRLVTEGVPTSSRNPPSRLSGLKSNVRPAVGSVPLAPRRKAPPVRRKQKLNPKQIMNAYGGLLAKGYRLPVDEVPKQGTEVEIDEFMERVASFGEFTMTGGRSTKELPAPKDDIEAALRLALSVPRDAAGRREIAIGLIALADFQDVDWCKANNVDPMTLRLHDEKRFVELLRSLGVPLP